MHTRQLKYDIWVWILKDVRVFNLLDSKLIYQEDSNTAESILFVLTRFLLVRVLNALCISKARHTGLRPLPFVTQQHFNLILWMTGKLICRWANLINCYIIDRSTFSLTIRRFRINANLFLYKKHAIPVFCKYNIFWMLKYALLSLVVGVSWL